MKILLLMNKDTPVLQFNPDEYTLKVLDERRLPYALRNNLLSSDEITSIKEGIVNFDKIRHFFADRTLSLSRENAKQILESIQNTQKLTEEESYRLSLKCRGVSINDCFWVKSNDEILKFKDIDIRNRNLSDVVFQISMIGTPISISHNILSADISTKGFFRKTWIREDDGLYLLKSDKTDSYINTKAELKVSDFLRGSNVKHIHYDEIEKDGIFCCKCKCATDENTSFVEAEYIKAYCQRIGIDFIEYIKTNYLVDFANMVVCDYIFANPDEHINNWGFCVDVDSNDITGLFPLFDNNQALIAIELNKEKEFDDLIYDPTDKTTLQSAIEWFPYCDLGIKQKLPERIQQRLDKIYYLSKKNTINVFDFSGAVADSEDVYSYLKTTAKQSDNKIINNEIKNK